MGNYNLTVGINLDDRTITSTIPDNTTISELKYIAKVNSNNYIAENVVNGESRGYYHYLDSNDDEVTEIFYLKNASETVTNVSNFTLPENFGTITEIDETATLYEYLTRVSHEKTYVITEDFAKQESLPKEQIKTLIEEEMQNRGVVTGSVVGWDSTNTIPGGYEEITNGDLAAINTRIDNIGTKTDNMFNSISVNNDTVKNMGSVELEAGKYLLIGVCEYPSNSTGYRRLGIALSATSMHKDRFSVETVVAVNGQVTQLQVINFVTITETTTFYLNTRHTAGSTLTVNGGLQVIKF